MSLGHLLSCFLLFAATVLLLIATLTAPIWHTVGFLTVRNAGVKSVFGTFGYCLSGGPNDGCSNTALGYDIASISGAVSDYTYINNHLDDVTKALILHPIACGLSTITFLTTLISHRTSFLISSFFSISTFIVTFVVMIIDFVLFGMIKYEIRHNTTGTADYSTGVWLVLSSTIVLFFSTFILIFEFFLGRRKKATEREMRSKSEMYITPVTSIGTGSVYDENRNGMGYDHGSIISERGITEPEPAVISDNGRWYNIRKQRVV